MFTLVSWLQKAIRRGLSEEACYAAAQLEKSGFEGAVWNILFTVASEDIGLACRGLVEELHAFHKVYKLEKARDSDHHPERLQITHAVLICCAMPKSRLVDHATILAFEGPARAIPEWADGAFTPPDWVFDVHTREGRKAGKDCHDFFAAENSALSPRSDAMPAEKEADYADRAEKIRCNQ